MMEKNTDNSISSVPSAIKMSAEGMFRWVHLNGETKRPA